VTGRRARRAGAALCAALVAMLGTMTPAMAAGQGRPATPIEHFFFLMQENHTFDNYFGTRPGVDGIPPGTCMPVKRDRTTPCVRPFHLGELGSLALDHTDDQDAFLRRLEL